MQLLTAYASVSTGCGHLLGPQDAAEALRFLPPGARVAADLDEHIRLGDVDAVVAHLGQEQRVDLRSNNGVES